MKSIKLITFAFSVLWSACNYSQIPARMFLGNASHLSSKNIAANDCFTKIAWKLDVSAAVRSTPVEDNKNIYFGTEKGDFFCATQTTGKILWKFSAPYPIHTSAAIKNGNVFFSDAKQTLYALSTSTGKIVWQTSLGDNKPYEWMFDFFWSSPTIEGENIFIGSGDGNLYAINILDGKIKWKFAATGHIRCSPAVAFNKVFFGDMNGNFYALTAKDGKKIWQYETNATKFVNDSFGYDRKGIVASPVVIGHSIVFGARDGYMYNLDTGNGESNWIFNYDITWVISSVATDGKAVYAGTSDGRYVNAIDLQTGKELWKSPTNIVWSSPLLVNDKLYVGGYDGLLYCIDKKTGIKYNTLLYTGSRIQSSPVLAGNKLFIGSDDGNIYALQSGGECTREVQNINKYVYYDREVPRYYYRNGTDLLLRATLANTGFQQINTKELEALLENDIAPDSSTVIVIASNYFSPEMIKNGKQSLLRKFLNNGGRLVLTGMNPAAYSVDEKTGQINTDFDVVKKVFDVDYKFNDSRSHGGVLYCMATKKGTEAGLPKWWMAPYSVDKKEVDIVLGENTYNNASAYVKKYSSKQNSGLIQLWIDSEFMPSDINFVRNVALANM